MTCIIEEKQTFFWVLASHRLRPQIELSMPNELWPCKNSCLLEPKPATPTAIGSCLPPTQEALQLTWLGSRGQSEPASSSRSARASERASDRPPPSRDSCPIPPKHERRAASLVQELPGGSIWLAMGCTAMAPVLLRGRALTPSRAGAGARPHCPLLTGYSPALCCNVVGCC